MFSCVPKKGSLADLRLVRGGEKWHSEVGPADMMDPHNRDPPPADDVKPSARFDIWNTYGIKGLPPEEIVQVLEDGIQAFSLDGSPGKVTTVELRLNTDDAMLHPEATRQVGLEKQKIMEQTSK